MTSMFQDAVGKAGDVGGEVGRGEPAVDLAHNRLGREMRQAYAAAGNAGSSPDWRAIPVRIRAGCFLWRQRAKRTRCDVTCYLRVKTTIGGVLKRGGEAGHSQGDD